MGGVKAPAREHHGPGPVSESAAILRSMPSMPAWHVPADPYFHDNTECFRVAEVPLPDRHPDEGGRPLCKVCRKLNEAEREAEG